MLLAIALVLGGAIPLEAVRQKSSETMSLFDWFFTLAIPAAYIGAAVALFLLRRVAVALFAVAFGLDLGYTAYQALVTTWREILSGRDLPRMVLVWLINVAIIAYAYRLSKSAVLT
jgi:hypothetical protein